MPVSLTKATPRVSCNHATNPISKPKSPEDWLYQAVKHEVNKEFSKAFDIYRKLADDPGTPNNQAKFKCGEMLLKGSPGVEPNPQLALTYLKMVVDGDQSEQTAIAAKYVGDLYCTGQNYTEALRYYQIAADQKFADAIYCLAMMHEQGLGVEANADQAAKLYVAAADLDHQGNRAMLHPVECLS